MAIKDLDQEDPHYIDGIDSDEKDSGSESEDKWLTHSHKKMIPLRNFSVPFKFSHFVERLDEKWEIFFMKKF